MPLLRVKALLSLSGFLPITTYTNKQSCINCFAFTNSTQVALKPKNENKHIINCYHVSLEYFSTQYCRFTIKIFQWQIPQQSSFNVRKPYVNSSNHKISLISDYLQTVNHPTHSHTYTESYNTKKKIIVYCWTLIQQDVGFL